MTMPIPPHICPGCTWPMESPPEFEIYGVPICSQCASLLASHPDPDWLHERLMKESDRRRGAL